MCRFKKVPLPCFVEAEEFKYITCVGSSAAKSLIAFTLWRLNTSHVSVQELTSCYLFLFPYCLNTSHVSVQEACYTPLIFLLTFKYITCVGSRLHWADVELLSRSFKYITCVGSRLWKSIKATIIARLNTSHVSVQVLFLAFREYNSYCLNTSHVSVQARNLL